MPRRLICAPRCRRPTTSPILEKVTVMQLLLAIILVSTLIACTNVRPDPAIFPIIDGGLYSAPPGLDHKAYFYGESP